jgi:hypothetical protein
MSQIARGIGLRLRRTGSSDFLRVRAHLRVCWPGVIVGLHLSPANVHELPVAERLLADARGWALGDRNYWSPVLSEKLVEQGLRLLAPYRSAKLRRADGLFGWYRRDGGLKPSLGNWSSASTPKESGRATGSTSTLAGCAKLWRILYSSTCVSSTSCCRYALQNSLQTETYTQG